MKKVAVAFFTVVTTMGLEACIAPFPHDRAEYGLRPDEVSTGSTSRAELTEKILPAARTPDNRFFLYFNAGSQRWSVLTLGPGVGVIDPLHQYGWWRWILIEFDMNGIVKNEVVKNCEDSCTSARTVLLKLLEEKYDAALAIEYRRMFVRITAFREAVEQGNVSAARKLIAQGADINAWDDDLTPLFLAVSRGDRDMVEVLLAHSADVNTTHWLGLTPLHQAARYGEYVIADLLLGKGADENAKDRHGETPLHRAVHFKHVGVVEALIANGADVNVRNEQGVTPLAYALKTHPQSPEIIELLQRHGAEQ